MDRLRIAFAWPLILGAAQSNACFAEEVHVHVNTDRYVLTLDCRGKALSLVDTKAREELLDTQDRWQGLFLDSKIKDVRGFLRSRGSQLPGGAEAIPHRRTPSRRVARRRHSSVKERSLFVGAAHHRATINTSRVSSLPVPGIRKSLDRHRETTGQKPRPADHQPQRHGSRLSPVLPAFREEAPRKLPSPG